MSKRLTDKEKAEVVADFVAGMSKSDIAKKFQVTHTAISKILGKQESFKTEEKVSKSFNKFQDETALDMLSFLESKKGQAQRLITIALDSVEDKLKKAYLKDTIWCFSIWHTKYDIFVFLLVIFSHCLVSQSPLFDSRSIVGYTLLKLIKVFFSSKR